MKSNNFNAESVIAGTRVGSFPNIVLSTTLDGYNFTVGVVNNYIFSLVHPRLSDLVVVINNNPKRCRENTTRTLLS